MFYKPKIIALIGPTASGKSEFAIQLAKKFNGEIISADSRQIYKGMDLGTGKIPGRWLKGKFTYKGIPHHLIDFVSAKRQYSSALFQKAAKKTITDVFRRGKLPIICGGTAHWVDAVAYNISLPNVKPNPTLRLRLEKQPADSLYKRLVKIDPDRAKTIDKYNKHRLIRALEIVITTGRPVPGLVTHNSQLASYQVLWLGIKTNQPDLYKKIDKRLHQRLKAGMLKEVGQLHNQGISWKKLESFGLEYKYISLYLQKKLSYDEMFLQLSYAIKHYSKRQMTWWKRNKEIIWIIDVKKAAKQVEKFLK